MPLREGFFIFNFKVSSKMSRGTSGMQLENLSPRATAIMDLLIQGMKPGEIAKTLSISNTYVSEICNAPQFQNSLAIRRSRIADKIDDSIVESRTKAAQEVAEAERVLKESAREAAERMAAMVNSGNDSIALRASAEILDRSGLPKQTSQPSLAGASVTVINNETAVLIKETMEMCGDCSNEN